MQNDLLWQPGERYKKYSRVARFMERCGITSWKKLIQRSRDDIGWFWSEALKDLGVEWFRPYQQVYDDSRGMPWTTWFLGGKLNIVHNCLDRHMRDKKGQHTAIIFERDDGSVSRTTYAELDQLVHSLASALLQRGIKKGDVVGLCMTLSPEAVAVMLATIKIGAISLHVATRIAPQEVVKSLNRGIVNALFIDSEYIRAGKTFRLDRTIDSVVTSVPSLTSIVIRDGLEVPAKQKDIRCISFNSFIKDEHTVETVSLDSEDPALILFSSGTTGESKAVVHTHAGALAQIVKEVGYAFDCREDDVFYWFTNIGWMMAPWEIIGTLFFGASLVLYEGTHLYPNSHRIFELIEKHSITIFGFIPTAMRSLAKLDERFDKHTISSIRILGSTGEPLDSHTWKWYFQTFGKKRCPIINISGGTELIGCLVSPLPVMPLKASTVGCPGLGMDVDIVNNEGLSVRGQPGFLVCKKPFPSMTRGFLGEPERYLQTYFSQGYTMWVHGDRGEVDEDGYWYLLGRSDDLIVKGGNESPWAYAHGIISSQAELVQNLPLLDYERTSLSPRR